MQGEAPDHVPLRVEERQARRRAAVVARGHVEEDRRAERRVLTRVGPAVGAAAVRMTQPRGLRGPQVRTGHRRAGRLRELFEQGEVVEHPERAAVRRDHHLLLAPVDGDVAHLHVRQVQAERLPALTAVEADVHRVLRPQEEELRVARILPHGEDVLVGRQAVGHRRPVLAVVGGLEHVGREVVPHVPLHREEGGPLRDVRRLDRADVGPFGESLRPDRLPVLPAVGRHVDEAIGGAGPDQIVVQRRHRHRRQAWIDLGARLIQIDRASGRLLRGRVVAREVRADLLPRPSAVGALEQDLRSDQQLLRVRGREQDRVRPGEPVLQCLGSAALLVVRPRADVLELPGPAVVAHEDAEVPAAVVDLGIAGFRHRERALAVGHALPGPERNVAVGGGARPLEGALVLLRAEDVVRELVVEVHVVELPGRLVVLRAPARPAIGRDGRAAVVPLEQDLRVVRVDPDDVVVAVRGMQFRPRLAAVARHPQRVDLRHVGRVRVVRVGEDAHVVEGALTELPFLVHARPGGAGVGRAEDAALLRLDDGVEDVRVGRHHRDAHPAERPGRQAGMIRDVRPVRAAVGRLVEAAARTAARQAPRRPLRLPRGRVQHLRVHRIHHQVDDAGLVVDEQNLAPRLAAIGGLEDAAVRAGDEHVAHRRSVGHVRVLRIDHDIADRVRVAEPGVLPRPAGIGRPVDAVTGDERAADVALARPHVDHVRVGRCHGHGADAVARAGQRAIGDVLPLQAVIGALPDAAVDAAHVEQVRVAGHAGDGDDAASDVGTDTAPLQRAHRRRGRRRIGRQRGRPRQRRPERHGRHEGNQFQGIGKAFHRSGSSEGAEVRRPSSRTAAGRRPMTGTRRSAGMRSAACGRHRSGGSVGSSPEHEGPRTGNSASQSVMAGIDVGMAEPAVVRTAILFQVSRFARRTQCDFDRSRQRRATSSTLRIIGGGTTELKLGATKAVVLGIESGRDPGRRALRSSQHRTSAQSASFAVAPGFSPVALFRRSTRL